MPDFWRSAVNKVNATNTIAKAGTQKQDERYNRAPRIPPPSDPPPYTPPQQHAQLHGENASYYTPPQQHAQLAGENTSYYTQPASPFPPASNAPDQQYGPFAPSQSWNQGYPNTHEHGSPQQRSDVAMYPPGNVMGQPGYSHNPYITTPPLGSPHVDYTQPQLYDNPNSPPQAPFLPPQRSQTEYGYVQSPLQLPRSYTAPVEPHDCNMHQHPILGRCIKCYPTQRYQGSL